MRPPSALRRACCLLVLLLVLVSCGGTTSTSAPTAAAPQATPVATRVLDLTDPSRATDPTPAEPGTDARPGRALPTTLWYPESGEGPFPVVVFSHGLNAAPQDYADLLSAWAGQGLVVAAPRFPLTASGTPVVPADVANQPADVSFVLTQVLALDGTPGDALEGRIDEQHVAAAGHSAGGGTTVGLLADCCRDARVTAAVVLAGTTLDRPVPEIAALGPVLFVHSAQDDVVPLAVGRALYEATPAPKAFLELASGGHSEPYMQPSDARFDTVRSATTDFLRWSLIGDGAGLADLRSTADSADQAQLTGDELGG